MISLYEVSKNVPPVSPLCRSCGKEMRLTAVTPAIESVVYRYLCYDHHVFEFKIIE
jgi:hypothetical protein